MGCSLTSSRAHEFAKVLLQGGEGAETNLSVKGGGFGMAQLPEMQHSTLLDLNFQSCKYRLLEHTELEQLIRQPEHSKIQQLIIEILDYPDCVGWNGVRCSKLRHGHPTATWKSCFCPASHADLSRLCQAPRSRDRMIIWGCFLSPHRSTMINRCN